MSSPDVVAGPAARFAPLPAIGAPIAYTACGAALLIALIILVSFAASDPSADTASPPSFEQLTFMP